MNSSDYVDYMDHQDKKHRWFRAELGDMSENYKYTEDRIPKYVDMILFLAFIICGYLYLAPIVSNWFGK